MQEPLAMCSFNIMVKSTIMALKILILDENVATSIVPKYLLASIKNFATEAELSKFLETFHGAFKYPANYYRWRQLIVDIHHCYKKCPELLVSDADSRILWQIPNNTPLDIWRLTFTRMTKIDLAMLQQANRFFRALITAFKKTADYELLRDDDCSDMCYMLTPKAISEKLPIYATGISITDGTLILPSGDSYYIFDHTQEPTCTSLTKVTLNLIEVSVESAKAINPIELLIGLSNKTTTLWRKNAEENFELIQTMEGNEFKVVSESEFILVKKTSLNLWSKKKDNNYIEEVLHSSDKTIVPHILNSNEIIVNITDPDVHSNDLIVLQRSENRKFLIQQEIQNVEDYDEHLKLNDLELASISCYGYIIFWKKNCSGFYEKINRVDLSDPNKGLPTETITLSNNIILCNRFSYFNLLQRNEQGHFHIVQMHQQSDNIGHSSYGLITKLKTGGVLFANSHALRFYTFHTDGLLHLTHDIKQPTDFTKLLSLPSGKIVSISIDFSSFRTSKYSFSFPKTERVIKKFQRPMTSAKDIIRRIQKAILEDSNGLPQKWNTENLKFWRRETMRINKSHDLIVHSFMRQILLHIKQTQNQIKSNPEHEDDIYSKAIDRIQIELADEKNYDDVKDTKTLASIYLWKKLITDFQQNRSLHNRVAKLGFENLDISHHSLSPLTQI